MEDIGFKILHNQLYTTIVILLVCSLIIVLTQMFHVSNKRTLIAYILL